jgi:predicted transposase/invertase (TIGR01784 family)
MPEDNAYHHRYTMYDPETRSEFTDLLEVHVLELPKLPAEDDGSDMWAWMKFIDVEDRKELDMIAEKDPEIGKAAARLLEISQDAETRLRMEFERRWEADQRVERRAAVREGREEGMEVGMEMGVEKERAMIIELIEKGLSLEDIKRVLTGQQKGGEG